LRSLGQHRNLAALEKRFLRTVFSEFCNSNTSNGDSGSIAGNQAAGLWPSANSEPIDRKQYVNSPSNLASTVQKIVKANGDASCTLCRLADVFPAIGRNAIFAVQPEILNFPFTTVGSFFGPTRMPSLVCSCQV